MVSWYRHGAARLTDPKHAFVHFSFTLLIFVSTNTRLDILFIPTPPPPSSLLRFLPRFMPSRIRVRDIFGASEEEEVNTTQACGKPELFSEGGRTDGWIASGE